MDFGRFSRYSRLGVGTSDCKRGRDAYVESTAMLHGDSISVGDGTYVGPYVYMRGHIEIGDMSWIGPFAQINGEGRVKIGRGVGIGNLVQILTCEHETSRNEPISFGELVKKQVIIEDGANIGIGSIILPGVVIEEGAQIGAGSVVTKETVIQKHEMWAGNPAKKFGNRKVY